MTKGKKKVESLTKDQVKELIKEKYGSYSNFARIIKMDRYKLQRTFLEKKSVTQSEVDDMHELVLKTPMRKLNELTEEMRVEMRNRIDALGGVEAVAKKFKIPSNTIWQILSGTEYQTVTARVSLLRSKLSLK